MVKKSLLPYGLSSSDPHIELPDVIGFKDERGSNASQYFNEKLNELKREYEALVQQARDTQLVYNAEYNFVPRIGHVYHLYKSKDKYILSLIENWNRFEYIGSYRFTSDNTWRNIGDDDEETRL